MISLLYLIAGFCLGHIQYHLFHDPRTEVTPGTQTANACALCAFLLISGFLSARAIYA